MINLYSCCIRPCPQYKVLPPWCSPHYNLIKGDPAHAEAGRRCPWENYKKLWRDDLAGVQPCTTPVPLTLWQQNAFFCCNLSVWVYVKKRQIGACKKNTRSFGALSSFFFFLLVGSKERQIWQFPTNVNWRMVSGLFFHKIFTLHQEWGLTLSFHE